MTRVLLIGVGVAVELDDVDMSWLRWFKKKKTIFVVGKERSDCELFQKRWM